MLFVNASDIPPRPSFGGSGRAASIDAPGLEKEEEGPNTVPMIRADDSLVSMTGKSAYAGQDSPGHGEYYFTE